MRRCCRRGLTPGAGASLCDRDGQDEREPAGPGRVAVADGGLGPEGTGLSDMAEMTDSPQFGAPKTDFNVVDLVTDERVPAGGWDYG